jgi:hypothetical protein
MLIENSIGTWSGRDMKESYYLRCPATATYSACDRLHTNHAVDQPYGVFAVDRLDGDKDANTKLLGSIAYITGSDRFHAPQLLFFLGVDSFEIANTAAYISPGTHTSKRPFVLQGKKQGAGARLTVHSVTGIGSADSVLSSDWDANEIDLGSTTQRVASVFSGDGGAQICKRYKNGVLTTEPLWPWPMNARIIEARIQSGRAPIDVTATIEDMFGVIPERCKG